MSLRRTDLRFALPRNARVAAVLGALPDWEEGLRLAGVQVTDHRRSRAPDLAVAPIRFARDALATGAEQIILEGRGGARVLGDAGLHVGRYLPLPGIEAPSVILPLRRSSPVAGYVLKRWRPAYEPLKRARDSVAAAMIRMGALPPLRPW